jgi:hypothetical protein
MKMVKSLLLGSAAGVVAVAGAQAADLPVKAKPVEYVKICSLYGDGFFYVPGTETCIRIGASMQADYYYNAAGNQQPLYYANGFNSAGGARDRTTSSFASRARADIGIDSRTQTSYGTLRTMVIHRIDNLDQGTVTPAINRAFIQWAGFTFGRARSYTDPEGMPGGGSGMLMLTQCQHCSDTVGGGAGLIAYTWEVGNGMSLSFGGEERRNKALVNLNQNFTVAANVETPAIPNNANPTSNRAGENFPNPWLAFRMSQDWGSFSAAIVGNLNNANYYGGFSNVLTTSQAGVSGQSTPACTDTQTSLGAGNAVGPGGVNIGGTTLCGHPNDKWGGAFLTGIQIKTPFTGEGDRFLSFFQYGIGASAYAGGSNMTSPALFGNPGNQVALGVVSDAVFCTPASQLAAGSRPTNCTGNLELTTAWAVGAGFEPYWLPNLSTKLYGLYGEHKYNSTVVNGGWMCGNVGSGVPLGTGVTTNANNVPVGGIVTLGPGGVGTGRCDPSFSMTMVMGQINYYPVPGFRLAVEATYTGIGTAFAGQTLVLERPTTTTVGLVGARPGGGVNYAGVAGAVQGATYVARDQNIVSLYFRAQRGFGGIGE